jgi:uncharacterized membrane protein YecN with MAPEG domain
MLPITLTMAAAAALINIWLAVRCIQVRIGAKIITGDGGNTLMLHRMRAQSNFAEYVPLFLILLGLVEYAKGPQGWLWGVGLAFIVGRVLHPLGMDATKANAFRSLGILLTWLCTLVVAGTALWIVYTGHR